MAAPSVCSAQDRGTARSAQEQQKLKEALEFLMDQTPVSELIGEYRLLVVGAPGMNKDRMNRLWRRQLKAIDAFSPAALDRKLLLINDSTRRDDPDIARFLGSPTMMYDDGGALTLVNINLRARPDIRPEIGEGWQVILVGLDGTVKKRWNGVVSGEDVFDLIDTMPMRQQELRTSNAGAE